MNLNNLNYNLMFLSAFFAAITTCFFAFQVGVKPVTTIFIRTLISFALFAAIGYFLGSYLKEEILSSMAKEENKVQKDAEDIEEDLPPLVLSNEKTQDINADNSTTQNDTSNIDDTLNQNLNEQSPITNNVTKSNEDGSFDKVVIVNNDAD